MLHDSGPVLLRGSRIGWERKCYSRATSTEEEHRVDSFFNTPGRALCWGHVRLCNHVCCTVRSDCGQLEDRNLWFRSSCRPCHVSQEDSDRGSEVLGWQFVLVPTFYLFHPDCQNPTYIQGRLYISSGLLYASSVLWVSGVKGIGLCQSSLESAGFFTSWEARVWNWSLRDYFRRKRCAKMAASSGLTGWASCPRRLTGGMLPN